MKIYSCSLVALVLGITSMAAASAASIFHGGQGPALIDTTAMPAVVSVAGGSNLNGIQSAVLQNMNVNAPDGIINDGKQQALTNNTQMPAISASGSANGQVPASSSNQAQ